MLFSYNRLTSKFVLKRQNIVSDETDQYSLYVNENEIAQADINVMDTDMIATQLQ